MKHTDRFYRMQENTKRAYAAKLAFQALDGNRIYAAKNFFEHAGLWQHATACRIALDPLTSPDATWEQLTPLQSESSI